ncbi:hypothetical protein As57867_017542, partial [Aphanomyces stellatus]
MGNHTSSSLISLEDLPLQGQLHRPLVLVSDAFMTKATSTYTMDTTSHTVSKAGKTVFQLKETSDGLLWNRRTECVDQHGNVVGSVKSGVVYAGKSSSVARPTAVLKTNSIQKTISIELAGRKRLQLQAHAHQAV